MSTARLEPLSGNAGPVRRCSSLLPGVVVAGGVAVVATYAGHAAPVVGAPVFAVGFGLLLSTATPRHSALKAGLTFSSRYLLRASIVVLGFGLSLHQVLAIGLGSLPVLLGTLIGTLAMAWLAGRMLRVGSNLTTLVGVGTAICGASAIAATNAVIDADEADTSYAIATIFVFNIVAVLTYPSLGHAMGLSQHSFGLWAGTAINDVSSVVAASSVYGSGASAYGVVVKLTRTLAIIPVCLAVAAWKGRIRSTGQTRSKPSIRRMFPTFILGFVGAVALNTCRLVPAGWHSMLHHMAAWLITAALAAVGLSADMGQMRRSGIRPLLLGAILWLTVGITSLLLQAFARGI